MAKIENVSGATRCLIQHELGLLADLIRIGQQYGLIQVPLH